MMYMSGYVCIYRSKIEVQNRNTGAFDIVLPKLESAYTTSDRVSTPWSMKDFFPRQQPSGGDSNPCSLHCKASTLTNWLILKGALPSDPESWKDSGIPDNAR